MGITWLAGEALSLVVTGLDNLIHVSEKAEESAKDFSYQINDMNKTHQSNASTIKDLNDEYKNLSSGVDNLGKNVSLTEDEFSRYHQITNQVADLMPNLVQGWDEQGNAILKVKGNLADLNSEYKKQQQNEAIEKYEKTKNGYNDAGKTLNNKIKASEYFDYNYSGSSPLFNFSNEEGSTNLVLEQLQNISNGSISPNDYKKKINSLLDKKSYTDKEAAFVMAYNLLYDEIKHNVSSNKDFLEYQNKAKDIFNKSSDEVNTSISQITTGMLGYAKTTNGYTNSKHQSEISSLLNSFSSDIITKNGLDDRETMETFISNLISDINNNKNNVQSALNSLFTLDINNTDLSPKEVKNKVDDLIKTIFSTLNIDYDSKKIDTLEEKLGLGDVNDNYDKYTTIINRFKDSDKIKDFFNTEGINTQEEIDAFNDITKGITDADLAIQKWNEHKKEADNSSTPQTFKSLWKSIGTGSDDTSKAAKEEKENLLKLAEQGKLTDKVFKKSSIAQTFTDAGFSIAEATKKINNLADSSKQLSSLKTNIKLIQDAFADKRDNGVAGSDTINALEPEFGKLKSWKKYKETLGSTTSTLNECRDAQNKLASEYVNNNNFLVKLVKSTGEVDDVTKAYYTSQLKELGIKNAKDVVDQQILNRQNEIHQKKSEEIIDIKTASTSLADATQDEIDSLVKEVEQLDGNTNALKLYLLQKMMSKDDAFDTEESVNNLINLADECNASETVINSLKGALKNLQDKGNVQLSIGLDFSVKNPLAGTSIGNSLIGNSLPTFPTLKESVINDVANSQQNLNDEFQKNKDNALSENEKRLRKQNKKLQAKINTLLKDAASSNSKNNGSSSSKSNTSKEFNWIDVLIKRTERKVQKSIDRITDYASKKTKNNLFGKALKAYGKEEKTYANASDFYLKKFNKVKISKNAKKDAEWKRKIKNGKLDIQTITNEKLADKISKAQDYYDNYLDYQDKQTGAKQNALALRKQKLDDDIAYIEAKSDRIQRLSDSVQNRIDNNDALGLAISENSYKELIKYSKKQVKRWIDEKATYAEYLSTLKRGSTEYIETEQKIADCDNKIQDAKKSQLEWNQTIAQMPLDKFEKFGNVISSIITNLGNFNSLLESQGKKMTSSQILSEISVRNQSIANKEQEIAYDEGERFTNAIRSIINAKYNGVYGTKIVNKEADPIANTLRPLFEKLLSNEISLDDFYSKASEQTHMTVDALKRNKELNDILTSVPDLESEKYSLMQEQEEYTDKLVDIEISKYQELRDEIEKANDAKQKAIELTKKEIALQKELENRTNFIYRNGKYAYEFDSSAVREKQNDLDNYYAQQQLDKLDEIIDKLGDLKNTLNYREGTEPIGDYKTNPSQLVEAAKRLIIGITGEVKGAYASGTTSAKGGLSLTGENGTELRVLNRGDGIIPAEITKNLMEFGVDPAKMIMDNLNKNIPDYKNIITPVNTSTDNSIHIDKVEMSGVNDVQSFMKELSHLTLDAQQRAYKR